MNYQWQTITERKYQGEVRSRVFGIPGIKSLRLLLWIILSISVSVSTSLNAAVPPNAIVVDSGGADDWTNPNRTDLSQMGFVDSGTFFEVFYSLDDTDLISGGELVQGCSLYDTNSNGKVDFALCTTFSAGVFTNTLHSCTDGFDDKCKQPDEINYTGSCTNDLDTTDPFAGVTAHQAAGGQVAPDPDEDTGVFCDLPKIDIGNLGASLLNVCTYPAGPPNSDAKDCVVSPGDGFLIITKIAPDGDTTTFPFLVNGSASNPPCEIEGNGSCNPIPISPGTINVSEVVPNNYDLVGADCLIGVAPTGTFNSTTNAVEGVDILAGQTTTCTFENELALISATLTLDKYLINDNGGDGISEAWALNAEYNDPDAVLIELTGNDANPSQGVSTITPFNITIDPDGTTISLSETGGPIGYTESDWSCVNGVTSLTVSSSGELLLDDNNLETGDTVSCTITNDDDAPSLKLAKTVVKDNGGTAEPSEWTLSAGDNDVTGSELGVEATNQAGTYALSESSVAGYTQTSLTCSDDPGVAVTSVTVGLGETITCTFVNDDDAPSLKLAKTVVKDNGGTAEPSEWTLSAGDNDVTGSELGLEATNQAGTYALSESSVAGYVQTSLTCSDDPGVAVTSVTVGLGETITCTFVNDDDAPGLTLVKLVQNDQGGTAVAGNWDLYAGLNFVTGSIDGAIVTNQIGVYSLEELSNHDGIGDDPTVGYILASLTCNNTDPSAPPVQVTEVTLGLGDNVTCTFINDDTTANLPDGQIIVKKETLPNGSTVEFGFMSNYFDDTILLMDGGSIDRTLRPSADIAGGGLVYSVGETGLPDDWRLKSTVCTTTREPADGDPPIVINPLAINLEDSEVVTCTFTNEQLGMVDLLKLTNGLQDSTIWNFTLDGPGVDASASTPPASLDFGGAKLIPGEEYTLCETGIPAGWTGNWKVDTDGDGMPDRSIMMASGVNDSPVVDGYSQVYDPNFGNVGNENDTRCVNFVIEPGETLAFEIDNQFPDGDQRTIGYWKNWSTCTNGNQTVTAAANGGFEDGWYILDDFISPLLLIGDLKITTCEIGVSILDKRDVGNGRKRAGDAAYGLAAQLLAAELNKLAMAGNCPEADVARAAAQQLLDDIGFDGTGSYLKGGKGSNVDLRAQANELASTLDQYNNGMLCPVI